VAVGASLDRARKSRVVEMEEELWRPSVPGKGGLECSMLQNKSLKSCTGKGKGQKRTKTKKKDIA
jgi:hypothetical protein